MLKALIQLFAEKFLTSKKSWVGLQSFPGNVPAIAITGEYDATWHKYTAPADGYINFTGSCSQCLFYNALGTGINYASGEQGRLFRGFIPVQKGRVVFYYVENASNVSFDFIPTFSSSAS